ncbi:MAG TPA: hypothetical protein VNH46_11455, partial [Gemmatimonadales bacterium]|nr:hypothetical protein [Gemmatimonadales bacterium]
FALFDGESDFNPAAVAELGNVSAGFVTAPTWRSTDTPAGSASLRDTRFPLISVGGPIPGTRVGIGVSVGSYLDQDFSLGSRDTIPLRGQPVGVFDTLTSKGGLSEIRLATGVVLSPRTTIGGGFYFITGSSRMDARRAFADSDFIPVHQTAELSYQGIGFSLGILHRLSRSIQLGALVRSDGKATVDLDSTRVYSVDLPYTFALGADIQASRRVGLALAGTYRTWSGANSDLLAQGGVGSRNTLALSAGVELTRDPRHPERLPLRLGVRYSQLPFPLVTGGRPSEFGVSAGTGTRFAHDRGGISLALEQVWRREGSAYREHAFSFTLGLSIRPYGPR